jgi:hypothetical protein
VNWLASLNQLDIAAATNLTTLHFSTTDTMARVKQSAPSSRRKKSKQPQPRKNLVALGLYNAPTCRREGNKLEYMNLFAQSTKSGTLKIGVVKFPAINQPKESLPVPAFINNPAAPTANEVFTSLDYLLKLRLFHPKEATKAADSIMRQIALGGEEEMNESNTIIKANSNFAHNFIEILAFNIAYNQFFYCSKWPRNSKKPGKNASEAIRMNAKVIHCYLSRKDKKVTKLLFPDGIKHINTNPLAILGVRNVLIQKAMNAIRFGFSGFPKKSLWVHQLFLLSTIHPRLNLNVGTTVVADLDQKAPEWKEYLTVKETEAGRNVFTWKGECI